MAYTRKSGWMVPSRRARGYVEERKAGKHKFKYKNDKPLTDEDKAFRSGYLFCQRDHAEAHKYFLAHPEKAEEARQRREAEESARQEALAHMEPQGEAPAKKPSKRKS